LIEVVKGTCAPFAVGVLAMFFVHARVSQPVGNRGIFDGPQPCIIEIEYLFAKWTSKTGSCCHENEI